MDRTTKTIWQPVHTLGHCPRSQAARDTARGSYREPCELWGQGTHLGPRCLCACTWLGNVWPLARNGSQKTVKDTGELTQRAHCCTPRKKPDAPPYMDFWDESLKCNTPGNIAFSSPLASPVSYSWAKFLRPVDPGGWVVWESSWSSFCPKSRGRTGCAVRDSGRRTQAWERCPKPTGTGNQLSYLNDHAADICIPKGWYF